MTRQRHPFRPGPAGGKISRTGWANAALVLFTVLVLVRAPTLRAGTLEPIPDAPPAPALRLADPSGTVHDLSALAGSVVVVTFWATWCSPCLTEMPGMQRLLDSFSDQPFRILAINDSEPRRRVERMVERLGVDFTVLLDANGSAMSAWGIKVLPTSFVVDQAGRVRYRVVGPYDWDGETGRQVVEDLLREKGSAARDSRSE